MEDFSEALNSILSSPEDMEKIMGLARELSGSADSGHSEQSTGAQIDPKLLSIAAKLSGDMGASRDKMRLIEALRPYFPPEKMGKMERAVRIAGLITAAKRVLPELGGAGNV